MKLTLNKQTKKLLAVSLLVTYSSSALAFAEILRNTKGIDWIAFIDADEFISFNPDLKLKKNNHTQAIRLVASWNILNWRFTSNQRNRLRNAPYMCSIDCLMPLMR